MARTPSTVNVCVCTFRRASLWATLASLAGQRRAAFRVIVADNDETPSAEGLVEKARAQLGLDIHYLHAPARNISVARNACLDAADAELIAFLDDDEVAPPNWLAEMTAWLEDRQLDVVFGPVRAQYPEGAPEWIVRGDFHSFRPAFSAEGEVDTGYTSNVLLRRAAVSELRFDPELGRTGGEDTLFFSMLHASGARLGFCPTGVLHEATAPARTRLSWLLQRSFRSGQTYARVLRWRGRNSLSIAGPAVLKAGYCALAAVLTCWSRVRSGRFLVRGALHVGVVAKALGVAEPTLYGGAPTTPAS